MNILLFVEWGQDAFHPQRNPRRDLTEENFHVSHHHSPSRSNSIRIVGTRGHVADEDLAAVKAAGYREAEIIEIILLVALNTLPRLMSTSR